MSDISASFGPLRSVRDASLKVFALAFALASTSVAALEGPCIDNYTKEGSFFKGRIFKSWEEHQAVPANEAYSRVYREVVRQGLTVDSADRELGIISAHSKVTGSAVTMPFSVVVDSKGEGSRVDLTVSSQGMIAVSEKELLEQVCLILNAARG